MRPAVAWVGTGGGPEQELLTSDHVELALTRFVKPQRRILREFAGAIWASPLAMSPRVAVLVTSAKELGS